MSDSSLYKVGGGDPGRIPRRQSLQFECNLKRRQVEMAIRESGLAQDRLMLHYVLCDEAQAELLTSAAELIARFAGTEGLEWLSKYSETRKPN